MIELQWPKINEFEGKVKAMTNLLRRFSLLRKSFKINPSISNLNERLSPSVCRLLFMKTRETVQVRMQCAPRLVPTNLRACLRPRLK